MHSNRRPPPEIRKASLILGIRPEDLTIDDIDTAWKYQRSELQKTGIHPDLGDFEDVCYVLNSARETLLAWLRQ